MNSFPHSDACRNCGPTGYHPKKSKGQRQQEATIAAAEDIAEAFQNFQTDYFVSRNLPEGNKDQVKSVNEIMALIQKEKGIELAKAFSKAVLGKEISQGERSELKEYFETKTDFISALIHQRLKNS